MARFRLRRKHKLNPRRKRRSRRKAKVAVKVTRRRRRRKAKKGAVLNPRRRRRSRARRNPGRRRRRRHLRMNPRRRRRHRRNPKGQPKIAAHKGKARRGSKRYRAIRRRVRRRQQLTAGQAAYASAAHRRGGSALRRLASKSLRRRSGASKGMKAVARAWRAAHAAKRLARGGKEAAYLRAAGLAGVPNPGLGAFKGAITLLPTVGGAAVGLLGLGWLGSKLGTLLNNGVAAIGSSAVAPYVGGIVTAVTSVVGYGVVRMIKPLARWSLPLFVGGMLAAIVQWVANIQLSGPAVGKDPTQPISESNPAVATSMSLGRKLGLPIGEYTMTGEYTHTGEYTSTGGTDDDPTYDDLRGTDDDPDFDNDLSGIFDGGGSGIF